MRVPLQPPQPSRALLPADIPEVQVNEVGVRGIRVTSVCARHSKRSFFDEAQRMVESHPLLIIHDWPSRVSSFPRAGLLVGVRGFKHSKAEGRAIFPNAESF